jgi:hypothetical protein
VYLIYINLLFAMQEYSDVLITFLFSYEIDMKMQF